MKKVMNPRAEDSYGPKVVEKKVEVEKIIEKKGMISIGKVYGLLNAEIMRHEKMEKEPKDGDVLYTPSSVLKEFKDKMKGIK